jgi:heptaprenyl diphosphate synthase
MSLSGGILSTLIMCALIRIRNNPFGILGVSIASAVGFNAGQLLVACIMSGTPALLAGYGPLLLLFAILTGALTGTVLRLVLPALEKQAVRFLPDSFRKRTGSGHEKSSS